MPAPGAREVHAVERATPCRPRRATWAGGDPADFRAVLAGEGARTDFLLSYYIFRHSTATRSIYHSLLLTLYSYSKYYTEYMALIEILLLIPGAPAALVYSMLVQLEPTQRM